ncbi:MAG: F0F1 ATP synthase subunit epsilon [Anaerolineae bacterium]|nr:F0F1 ATP synthase subunit epsilon [Anaerolineae bacterium]
MSTMRCEIVTVERVVYQDDVNMVIAPGIDGQMGILPRHAALITALTEGELVIHKEGQEDVSMAIGGGFLEVSNNKVTILADTAERAEEIDEARAADARKKAEEALKEKRFDAVEFAKVEAALRRSLVRLKVARRRGPGGGHAGNEGD